MSTQERFTAAIEQAKSEGVSIRLNAEAHDNSGDDSPLFTFDFDGKLEWVWDDLCLVDATGNDYPQRNINLYFLDSPENEVAAKVAHAAFAANGFTVGWMNTPAGTRAITVYFD